MGSQRMALTIIQYMLISLFSSSGLFFGFLLGILAKEEIKHKYFDYFETTKQYLFLLYGIFSVLFYAMYKTNFFLQTASIIFIIGLPIGTVLCRKKEPIGKYFLSSAGFLAFTYLFFRFFN